MFSIVPHYQDPILASVYPLVYLHWINGKKDYSLTHLYIDKTLNSYKVKIFGEVQEYTNLS